MEEIIIDTDIFIDIFRGDEELKDDISRYERYTTAITYIELIQGKNTSRKQIREIDKSLSDIHLLHIIDSISRKGVKLVIQYGPSHNLNLADALIAATALEYNFILCTNNKKDFHFIEGLNLS